MFCFSSVFNRSHFYKLADIYVDGFNFSDCPDPFTREKQQCFYLSDAAYPWDDAQDLCISNLAVIARLKTTAIRNIAAGYLSQ